MVISDIDNVNACWKRTTNDSFAHDSEFKERFRYILLQGKRQTLSIYPTIVSNDLIRS